MYHVMYQCNKQQEKARKTINFTLPMTANHEEHPKSNSKTLPTLTTHASRIQCTVHKPKSPQLMKSLLLYLILDLL